MAGMNNNAESKIHKKESKNCPFIGIKEEPDSFFGYASPSNYCFHATPPGSVKRSHQDKYCLTGSFRECEVFFSSGLDPLPAGIHGSVKSRKSFSLQGIFRFGLPSIVAFAIILTFLFLIFRRPLYGNRSSIPNSSTQAPDTVSLTNTINSPLQTTIVPAETDDFILSLLKEETLSTTQIPANTPSPTPSPTFTSTFTPDFTPGPGLETPFGPDSAYILHVVAEGESYPKLADIYNTAVDVIKATNIIPVDIGLRTGMVIVVMPDVKEADNLTPFVTKLVDKSVSIEDIAREYQIDLEEIIFYNQVNPEKTLPVGRYLIIPVKPNRP
jgi:LysM repeat protein